MILLEKADELHRHIDECHYCTAGARDGILCFPGRLLLAAAMGEAALLSSRAASYDRALSERKNVAADTSEALRLAIEADRMESGPRRRKIHTNGVSTAGDKLRERVSPQLAEGQEAQA